MQEKVNKKTLNPRSLLLLSIGVIFIALGAYLGFDRLRKVSGQTQLPNQEVISEDIAEPVEIIPKLEDYDVPPDQIKFVEIDKFQLRSPVQIVGLNSEGAVSVPTNVHFAGWYNQSPRPGQDGVSLVVGHVSGRYTDGAFKQLGRLVSGDKIKVVYGDNSVKTFTVNRLVTLPVSQVTEFMLAQEAGVQKQLNLITCAGKYDKNINAYPDRTLVITSLDI